MRSEVLLTFLWTAEIHARRQVCEAVGVPPTASIGEGLTLHGAHVEEVAGKEGAAVTLLLREPADLRHLCKK